MNGKPRPSDLDHLRWLNTVHIDDFSGLSVLDLGCGSGYICQHVVAEGATHALGIDIEKPEFYSEHCGWHHSAANLDSDDWAEQIGRPFDLIFAFDIIEHLHSPSHFLKNCRTLLNKGGILVLTTPNTNSWERLSKPDRWSGATDPQHLVLFNQYSLQFLLGKLGFQVHSMAAPIRSLSFLGRLCPQVGGQLIATATPLS